MSQRLEESVNNIIDNNPAQAAMVVDGMGDMPSLDNQDNDPKKVFAFLNSHMEYVVNFFKDPNSDPQTFGPPGCPQGVRMSKQDLNNFTARATNFVSDNWDALQGQAVLKGDGSKRVSTTSEVKLKTQQVGRQIENHKESKGLISQSSGIVTQGIGGPKLTDGNKRMAKSVTKGAILGFFKGGKAGAVKGATVALAEDMGKDIVSRKRAVEDTKNQQENRPSGPSMR